MTDDSRYQKKLQEEIQVKLALLRAANEGRLEQLPCPQCKGMCLSVWFTHPAETEYRTWFVCEQCGFEFRAQNDGKPPHYSLERDRTGRKKEAIAGS